MELSLINLNCPNVQQNDPEAIYASGSFCYLNRHSIGPLYVFIHDQVCCLSLVRNENWIWPTQPGPKN